MSRSLKVHERKDTVKWVLVALALLLVGAILCGLMTNWYKEFNPFCWFGHNYGDDGECSRCGKPAEEPEPQAFVSESYRVFASANSLSSENKSSGFEVGLQVSSIYCIDFHISGQMLYQGLDTEQKLFTATKDGVNVSFYLWFDFVGSDDVDIYLTDVAQSSEDENRRVVSNCEYLGLCYFSKGEMDEYGFSAQFNIEFTPLARKYTGYTISAINTSFPAVDSFLYEVTLATELPPAPIKTGYTFTGWYTDEACTNKYTDDYVTEDITLYAGFRAHTYSITFNANSGSGTMANEAMTYDTAKNLTANSFTKEHYQFKGWATSADGDVVYSNSQSVKNLTAEDNATVELFAKWERSEVCVSFVSEGNTVATIWIAIGTKATLPENPVKEGHLFNGWYYEDGTKYEEQNISEDITLTAKFDVIRCTVTFVVDGEVYAVYVCDWGTSIAQALNGAGVNTVLYKADEHSGNF